MSTASLNLAVFTATDMIATDGVMKGAPLSIADELVLDDVFILTHQADMQEVRFTATDDGLFKGPDTGLPVHIDCCLTFMAPDASTVDALVLVVVDHAEIAEVLLLPLSDLARNTEYRIVGIARHTATRAFAQSVCGSFAQGTHITMHDGQMRPIESLAAGDQILTRDAGKQEVRYIWHHTLRASGVFAPVVISKGTLHNAADLVVRPDLRLFVYQREDQAGAGRAEVLIKARHLVNDTTVRRKTGGFIDYYQLVLDDHQIIYAEGIAAESQLIDATTRPALPLDVRGHQHQHRRHLDYEVAANLLPPEAAAEILRSASSR